MVITALFYDDDNFNMFLLSYNFKEPKMILEISPYFPFYCFH